MSLGIGSVYWEGDGDNETELQEPRREHLHCEIKHRVNQNNINVMVLEGIETSVVLCGLFVIK